MTSPELSFIYPGWPCADGVKALVTTRQGGASGGAYATLNLGMHVGDNPDHVAQNRNKLLAMLPGEPKWLAQMHGTTVVAAHAVHGVAEADAAWTDRRGVVCAVLVADCLPVLLCDRDGSVVAAAHAGWRGLAAGVIERTVEAMGKPGRELIAWLGPAIGAQAFEVGQEVRDAFVSHSTHASAAFLRRANGQYLADIYALARQRLRDADVTAAYGGGFCTVNDSERFFSYRRDRTTGRMAALIWLSDE
jgi:hypothetical protein